MAVRGRPGAVRRSRVSTGRPRRPAGADAKRGFRDCGTGGETALPVRATTPRSAVLRGRTDKPGAGPAAVRGAGARAGFKKDGERRTGQALSRLAFYRLAVT